MYGVGKLDDLAQKIRVGTETLDDSGHLLPAGTSAPEKIIGCPAVSPAWLRDLRQCESWSVLSAAQSCGLPDAVRNLLIHIAGHPLRLKKSDSSLVELGPHSQPVPSQSLSNDMILRILMRLPSKRYPVCCRYRSPLQLYDLPAVHQLGDAAATRKVWRVSWRKCRRRRTSLSHSKPSGRVLALVIFAPVKRRPTSGCRRWTIRARCNFPLSARSSR